MYADNMTKLVRDTWLSPWAPPKSDSAGTENPEVNTVDHTESHEGKSESKVNLGRDTHAMFVVFKVLVHYSRRASFQEAKSSDAGGKKIPLDFLPGRVVLARYTDGRSYPAAVTEKLDDGSVTVVCFRLDSVTSMYINIQVNML